jgi:3-methyladenine DNA glycosylase/8-oxoguanine DNA glycosylase
MPAVIRRTCFHGGSIRMGPECFSWLDDYTRALTFEVERVNVAVIGGLTDQPHSLTRQEYRWIEAAMIAEGLRFAMDRVMRDKEGKPVLDECGKPTLRRVMLAMPSLKKRNRPALFKAA